MVIEVSGTLNGHFLEIGVARSVLGAFRFGKVLDVYIYLYPLLQPSRRLLARGAHSWGAYAPFVVFLGGVMLWTFSLLSAQRSTAPPSGFCHHPERWDGSARRQDTPVPGLEPIRLTTSAPARLLWTPFL